MIFKRMYADDVSAYLAMEATRRRFNDVIPFSVILEEERADGVWHVFWNLPNTINQDEFDRIVEEEILIIHAEFDSGEENRQPH